MAEVSVGILGLGRTGASIGLALKRHSQQGGKHKFTVTGADSNSSNVKQAQKIKAVDKVENRIENAARGQDIVVMALPYGEVETAYSLMLPLLRPGAVIIDLSPLKQPVLRWAAENLSPEIHIVCAAPIVNPKYLFEGTDETARATDDFFNKGTFMLMPSVNCIQEAIALASDFAGILGAEPHFYDASEHDALIAGTEALPSLVGMLYFYAFSQSSGWGDTQRLTNPAFGMLTRHLFDAHPDDLRQFWLDSSGELLRHLDDLIANLNTFRTLIAEGDRDAVDSALETASAAYEAWVNRRYNNRWQDAERLDAPTPSFGSAMGTMLGGSALAGRLGRGKKDDK
jgi:prephenate dehydrogenase